MTQGGQAALFHFCVQFTIVRHQPDLADDRPDRFARGGYVLDVFQLLDQATVDFPRSGQDLRRLECLHIPHPLLGFLKPRFGLFQRFFRAGGDDACAQGGQKVVDLGLRLARLSFRVGRVGLAGLEDAPRLFLENAVGLFRQDLVLDGAEHQLLDRLALDAQVVRACRAAAIDVGGAAVAVSIGDDVGSAAAGAAQQAGEQVFRLAAAAGQLAKHGALVGGAGTDRAGAGLGGLPGGVVDDLEFGVLGDHPLGRRTQGSAASAGVRVLDPFGLVPDLPTGIEGIAEQAHALGVRVDGGGRPGSAPRRTHALTVELGRDRARRFAGDVALEDPPHPARLLLVDRPPESLSVVAGVIAVGKPAGAVALQRLAHEASVGFLSKVVEVKLGHEATEAGLELVAGALGVEPVGDADQADAEVFERAHGHGRLDVVARQARQVVDQQHVEAPLAGGIHHRLVARPVDARAGDRLVLEQRRAWPADPITVRFDVAQLVADRGLALGVGRVAGVGGGAHGVDSLAGIGGLWNGPI